MRLAAIVTADAPISDGSHLFSARLKHHLFTICSPFGNCDIVPQKGTNMRLLGRKLLQPLYGVDPETDRWLSTWSSELTNANWKGSQQVFQQFPSVLYEEPENFYFRVAKKATRVKVSFCFSNGIAVIGGLRND